MQTFLPYSDFRQTMACLDPKRLGNQVYREGLTLIRGGWSNHPASKMWRGHRRALAYYCLVGLNELWLRRKPGCNINFAQHRYSFLYYFDNSPSTGMPPWLGNKEFHDSHKSNLLRKDPEWYGQFNWNVPNDLPYIWPEK